MKPMMLVLCVCLAGCDAGEGPQTASGAAVEERSMVDCESASKLASSIMLARQYDMPMSHAMGMAASYSQPLRQQTEAMIVSAYESPHFQTEEHIQREALDFANQAYLACTKANR